jgi:hypothetical protein
VLILRKLLETDALAKAKIATSRSTTFDRPAPRPRRGLCFSSQGRVRCCLAPESAVPIRVIASRNAGSGSYHNLTLSHKTCNSARLLLLSAIETGLQSRWVINAG